MVPTDMCGTSRAAGAQRAGCVGRVRRAVALAMLCGAMGSPVAAQPVVVECDWVLERTIGISKVGPIAYNPMDDCLYVAGTDGLDHGVHRIAPDGTITMLVRTLFTYGVAIDPDDGDVFFSDDGWGSIYRYGFGETIGSLWISGFHDGDDDPVGIIVVPNSYTGTVVAPGTAISTDRGRIGPDEVWTWSPDVAEGEVLLVGDDGTLPDPFDVAANDTHIIVVSGDESAGFGGLWEVMDSSGTLRAISVTPPLENPVAAVFDPVTGDLLVNLDDEAYGANKCKVVRVNLATGTATDVITGFTFMRWASIDIRPDGQRLWVADYDLGAVFEYRRRPPCVPDLNGDCYVDSLDVLVYLNLFSSGDLAADMNGDGFLDSLDLLIYLNLWSTGC